MALAVLAGMTSCSKEKEQNPGDMPAVKAPATFGDSLATTMGQIDGISLNNMLNVSGEKLDKDKFLAGMKLILMADTSEAYQTGMLQALSALENINRAKAAGVDINVEMYLANYAKEFKAEKPDTAKAKAIATDSVAIEQAGRLQETIMMYQYQQQAMMQAQMAQMFDKNVNAGNAFMAEVKKDKDVKTTPSGMTYKIITMGNGPKAKAGSKVKAIYTGSLIDGTVFDSSRGQVAEFSTDGVVPGFAEALTTFPAGTHLMLYLPQELAYGQEGAAPVIQPGSTIVFDLQIVE